MHQLLAIGLDIYASEVYITSDLQQGITMPLSVKEQMELVSLPRVKALEFLRAHSEGMTPEEIAGWETQAGIAYEDTRPLVVRTKKYQPPTSAMILMEVSAYMAGASQGMIAKLFDKTQPTVQRQIKMFFRGVDMNGKRTLNKWSFELLEIYKDLFYKMIESDPHMFDHMPAIAIGNSMYGLAYKKYQQDTGSDDPLKQRRRVNPDSIVNKVNKANAAALERANKPHKQMEAEGLKTATDELREVAGLPPAPERTSTAPMTAEQQAAMDKLIFGE